MRENSDDSSDEGVSRLLSSDLSRLTIDEEPDRQDNPYRLFEDPFAGSDLSSAPQQAEPPSPIARQLAVPPSWTLQEVTTGPPSQNTRSLGRTASRPTTQSAAKSVASSSGSRPAAHENSASSSRNRAARTESPSSLPPALSLPSTSNSRSPQLSSAGQHSDSQFGSEVGSHSTPRRGLGITGSITSQQTDRSC